MRRRALCGLEEIPDGGAKGFAAPPGGFTGLFAVRRGDKVFVYRNSCPHAGTPLDIVEDHFLSADAERIVCATHGAEFAITTGACLAGPCFGEALEPVASMVEGGVVLVALQPSDD